MKDHNIKHYPKKYWLLVVIFMAIPLSGLSIDINIPSLPAMSQYFHVDKSWVQLNITLYLLGYSVFQLFAGSLSDSLGRKSLFMVAMVIYVLAVVITTQTQHIDILLALRLIQGMALASCNVCMRAAISDLFKGHEFHKIMNYSNMTWSLGPIIAPAIGGYLQYHFGWQAPFYCLSIYAFIVGLGVFIVLPETIAVKQPLNLKVALENYKKMLSHSAYLTGLLCLGLIFSIGILFNITAPFLIQNKLHYSADQFGMMALLMGMALFLGTLSNRLLLNVNKDFKIAICFWLMLICALMMVLFACVIPMNLISILVPSFCLIYFVGIVFPNYYAQCIALFSTIAGSANALMGSGMILIPGAISIIGSTVKANNQLPLALIDASLVLICLCLFYWNKKQVLKQQRFDYYPVTRSVTTDNAIRANCILLTQCWVLQTNPNIL